MAPRNEAPGAAGGPWLQRPAPGRYLSTASKQSFRSHSSSVFEADDERSPSPHRSFTSVSTMDGNGRDSGSRRDGARDADDGRYDGEDTRLTSDKELAGWYMYAFASETYVICG